MNPKFITRTDIFYNGHPTLRTLSRAHILRNICAMSSVAAKEMFEAVGLANRNARMKP